MSLKELQQNTVKQEVRELERDTEVSKKLEEKFKALRAKAKAEEIKYLTYYQKEKRQKRKFIDGTKLPKKYHRYQSYPPLFEFEPKDHDNEPNRIADFFIDFDSDQNIALAILEAIAVIKYFSDKYGIPETEWRISFSGGKGVHLRMKASVLGLEAGRWNLPLIYKNLMQSVVEKLDLKTADLSIYNMKSGKPFRLENHKRENGNYEVPVRLPGLTVENHDSYIKAPRELEDTRTGALCESLRDKIIEIEEELKKSKYLNEGEYFPDLDDEPPCIPAILDNRKRTAGKCDFNIIMMTLTRSYLSQDIGYEEAMTDQRFRDLVYEFESGSLKTERDRENNVRNRFDSMAMAGSEFGCGYSKGLGISLGCDGCPVELGISADEEVKDHKRLAREYLEKDSQRVENLDVNLLPEALQSHIKDVMDRTEVHPLMVLNGILGAASAAIGTRAYIPWFGSDLRCNIYSLLINVAGSGKTTVLNMTMKDIRRKTSDMINNIRNEKSKNEPDETLIAGYEKEMLTISPDITLQALVNRLNKQGGVIACSEFGSFIKGLQAGGNAFGMVETIADLYDGCVFSKETVGRGLLYVEKPYLSICGFSTLEFLQGQMSKSDIGSGSLARYLFFYPPASEIIPPALPKYLPSLPEMTVYEELADMAEVMMELSEEAQELHEAFHERIYKDLKIYGEKAGRFLEPFLKRWSANAVKLSMIFQQLEEVGSVVVEVENITAAHHVVDLAIESTKLLFDNKLGLSDHQAKCEKVLKYIARKDGEVPRGQILKNHVLTGGAKELDYVLESLFAAESATFTGGNLKSKKTKIRLS